MLLSRIFFEDVVDGAFDETENVIRVAELVMAIRVVLQLYLCGSYIIK